MTTMATMAKEIPTNAKDFQSMWQNCTGDHSNAKEKS